jgi:hypothetical protein
MSYRTVVITLLAVVAAGCSQQDKKPRLPLQAVVGSWASDTLPDAAGAKRVYRLRMDAQGMAEFVSTAVGGAASSERGTWDGADSLVRVLVRGEGTASRPTSLLLAIRGGNELGLVRFDSTAWGARGLTLYRQTADSAGRAR